MLWTLLALLIAISLLALLKALGRPQRRRPRRAKAFEISGWQSLRRMP